MDPMMFQQLLALLGPEGAAGMMAPPGGGMPMKDQSRVPMLPPGTPGVPPMPGSAMPMVPTPVPTMPIRPPMPNPPPMVGALGAPPMGAPMDVPPMSVGAAINGPPDSGRGAVQSASGVRATDSTPNVPSSALPVRPNAEVGASRSERAGPDFGKALQSMQAIAPPATQRISSPNAPRPSQAIPMPLLQVLQMAMQQQAGPQLPNLGALLRGIG